MTAVNIPKLSPETRAQVCPISTPCTDGPLSLNEPVGQAAVMSTSIVLSEPSPQLATLDRASVMSTTSEKSFRARGGGYGTITVKIDPEFESLVPPLSDLEFAQLRDNIRNDEAGVREPLAVWAVPSLNESGLTTGKPPIAHLLLDGHNRYRAWKDLTDEGVELPPLRIFPVSGVGTREDALLWIETNQLGRRNLSDDQRAVLWNSILERRSAIARKHRAETARAAQTTSGLSDSVTDKPKQDTRKEVAREANIPERKLRTVRALKAKAPELVEKVRAGKLTLQQAKKQAFKAEVNARKAEHAADAPISQLSAFIQHANKFYVAAILGDKLGAEIGLLQELERRPTGVVIGCKDLAKTLRKIADASTKYAEALEAFGAKS